MKKAVILAGGTGSRLRPLTNLVSKQLLPIYNKPMIYYPLSLCMMAGIKEIAIILTQNSLSNFQSILGTGSDYGIKIEYIIQKTPEGIPQGIDLAKKFIGKDKFLFLLGDNIIVGHNLPKKIDAAFEHGGATAFAYYVNSPNRFGIFEFDRNNNVISAEEKPINPKSNWGSIGVYILDSKSIEYFQGLKKSMRGEYEMPDLLNRYIKNSNLKVEKLGRGYVWFDTGTIKSYFNAINTIKVMEKSSNQLLGSIDEIAIKNGWISKEKILNRINNEKSDYFQKIKDVIHKDY